MKLFLRNRSAAVGLVVLALVVLAAAFAGLIAPHDPGQTVGPPL